MRSSDHYMDSQTWMPDYIPPRKWNCFCRRAFYGAHETFSGSPGSFKDVPSPGEWLSRKTTSDSGFEKEWSYEKEWTNLCVLECLKEKTSVPKETSVTIQDVDCETMKHTKSDKCDPSWATQERPLFIASSNLKLKSGMRSIRTSMDIFSGVWG